MADLNRVQPPYPVISSYKVNAISTEKYGDLFFCLGVRNDEEEATRPSFFPPLGYIFLYKVGTCFLLIFSQSEMHHGIFSVKGVGNDSLALVFSCAER